MNHDVRWNFGIADGLLRVAASPGIPRPWVAHLVQALAHRRPTKIRQQDPFLLTPPQGEERSMPLTMEALCLLLPVDARGDLTGRHQVMHRIISLATPRLGFSTS